jgi:starch-binding outer membrane protein, SusD/RagB family
MKKIIIKTIAVFFVAGTFLTACKKEVGNLNNPTVEDFLANASKAQLNNLVTGIQSGVRNNYAMYLDVIGVIGREIYRFSGADPRYVSDLLGQGNATLNNNTFYLTNPWNSRYRVVKNANVLIESTNRSTLLTDVEKKGYLGWAKTMKAYQLLMNLNMTYTNGIRIQVDDPNNLGPIVDYNASLAAIASLLDEAKTDFTGATITFPLSGMVGLSDAAGLIKFNRALAARVAAYRAQWPQVLTALNESFFAIDQNFNVGAYMTFGTGTGDQLNQAFFPQNQGGELRLAHPSYATDIAPGDDRIGKATLRTTPGTSGGLTSNRDVWVYTTSTDPIAIIRNEELILLYAEAKLQTNSFADAKTAIDKIRVGHGLAPYAGALTQAALLDELLIQRRFSLFYEGHRWVDMRRYNRLNQLPIDRPGDDVWVMFPLPLTEE